LIIFLDNIFYRKAWKANIPQKAGVRWFTQDDLLLGGGDGRHGNDLREQTGRK